MCSSSGAIFDAILHDRISPRRLSPVPVDASRDISRALAVPARMPRPTALLSLALDRLARVLPPVSGIPAVESRPLLAHLGGSRRSSGVRGSRLSPSSPVPSISEYFLRFRDLLDG